MAFCLCSRHHAGVAAPPSPSVQLLCSALLSELCLGCGSGTDVSQSEQADSRAFGRLPGFFFFFFEVSQREWWLILRGGNESLTQLPHSEPPLGIVST